jgi:hypothetical protein
MFLVLILFMLARILGSDKNVFDNLVKNIKKLTKKKVA